MNKLLCLYSISKFIRGAKSDFTTPIVAKCILLERAVSAAGIELIKIEGDSLSLDFDSIALDKLITNNTQDEIKDYADTLPGMGEWGEYNRDENDRLSTGAYEHHGYTILTYFRALNDNDSFNMLLSRQHKISTKLDDIDNIKKLSKHNVVKLNETYFGEDFIYLVDKEIVIHLQENEFGIHNMKTGRNTKFPYHRDSNADAEEPKLAV
ncbi:hypothetical protein LMH73_020040, partial [Vibrio splendidus]